MSITTTELKTELVELSSESFDTFCEDISSMFGVEMGCNQNGELSEEKVIDLKKRFKKISAFNTVNTEGKLDGKFYLVFDQAGTFILSGTIVMMPEKRILEQVKKGLIQDIESMTDAIKETGNLAVGSWDRIFRENFSGHGHFVQGNVYVGNPWDNTKDTIGLDGNEEIIFIPYEITISPFPTFKCGVIFPRYLFEEKPPMEVEIKSDATADDKQDHEPEKPQEEITKENVAQKNETNPETEIISQTEATKAENADLTQEDQKNTLSEQPEVIAQESKTPHNEPEIPKQDGSGQISKSIQDITQSPASLPGESGMFLLNIKAKDIMHDKIIWCLSEDSVEQAMAKIQQHNTRYILIGDEKQGVCGIISQSDLDAAMSPYLRPIFSKWRRELDDATLKIKLKWIMNRNVCFVKAQTPVIAIIQEMKRSAKLCLPVIENDKVLGVITITDILSAILAHCPDEYKVLCDEI